ncbi:Putative ribose-phosphate pyrophosphokinase [Methylobacterium crusticola]|uniref:Ribose-phosphate pyrophosphokinase n=1 Tax=Methylobacterium crusticola TaxID=1697972 RepID=A0ABQ4QS42_9HYPH|nr:double zinc ribbon domain-containing protein [Methylobacterium crusticola]GJD48118.1 Putative ribose-phosphate pyrophosphokinase [Methylobacterium crusticola]
MAGAPAPGRRTGTLRHLARAPGLVLRAAVGLIYPPSCIGCGAATGVPHALCPACWGGMRFIERPYCERLGTPFSVDLGVPGLLSPAALADPPVFERARAAARYDATARRLVQRLKYEDRLDLAAAMGAMMARAGRELLAEADVVVPVPLWRWRLWRRRFNQAAVLARHAARGRGVPVEPGLLARVRPTRRQVGLTRAARAENLQGAFRVPEAARPRLAGRRVLLVDDVVTTGATANAAARALMRGGAAAVDVLAFARVVSDGLDGL